MASISIDSVPDDVYRQIQARAKRDGISVEQEAAKLLSDALAAPTDPESEAALMAAVREAREAVPDIYVTEDELQAVKREGRA